MSGIEGVRSLVVTYADDADGDDRTIQQDFHPALDGVTVRLVLNDGRLITVGATLQVLGPDSETLLEVELEQPGACVICRHPMIYHGREGCMLVPSHVSPRCSCHVPVPPGVTQQWATLTDDQRTALYHAR